MGWLEQQATDLFAYGWAVGVYWLALMGILFLIAGDGADWVAPNLKARLNTVIPAKPRRQLEIGLMILAVFLAGFETWHDQSVKTDALERQRQGAVHWLTIWKTRADGRWHEANDKGGYKDQILALQNKPPAVITRTVPVEHQVFIPTGGAPRSRFAASLQGMYGDGATILQADLREGVTDEQIDGLKDAANRWANSTATWIQKNISSAAAQKFVKPSEKPSLSYNLTGTHKNGVQDTRNSIANSMNGWLDNLQEIMDSTTWDPP